MAQLPLYNVIFDPIKIRLYSLNLYSNDLLTPNEKTYGKENNQYQNARPA
jgi:hypothetical protein